MKESLVGLVAESGREVRVVGRSETFALVTAAEPFSVVAFVRTGDRADVTAVAARAGSARAALYAVVDGAGLDPNFGDDVMAEVEEALRHPGLDDATLLALDDVPFVTIDGAGTRDLDQAVHIELDGDGFRVRYAIADASHYVRHGTKLFDAALERGASYYLPGLVLPMLPRPLSEGLISLGPDGPKRAVVFDTRVRRDGSIVRTDVVRARIRSRGKLAFGDVQAFLDGEPGHRFAGEPFASSLRLLPEIGRARLADAAVRNVVRYRREETEVRLDDEGEDFVVTRSRRHDVELYNEQLSLLCNAEGARFVLEGAEETPYVEPIYRVHPAPEAERVEALARTIAEVVRLQGLDPERYRFDPRASLAEYVARLPTDGPEARVAAAIERQAVLVNVRSMFSSTPGEHHGVGVEPYARFSAPMREVVGVYVHAEACEKLAGRPLISFTESAALRDAVIEASNRAKDRQRTLTDQANRLVLDRLFARDLASAARPVRRGTVMGVAASKVYVAFDEPAIDVKLYIGDLGRVARSFMRLDEAGACLLDDRGRTVLAIGDEIALRCEGRDEVRNRFILLPTELPRLSR